MSKSLVKSDDSLGKDVSEALFVTGAGGLVLAGAAWLLPFVTLPMLLIVAVVLGLVGWFK